MKKQIILSLAVVMALALSSFSLHGNLSSSKAKRLNAFGAGGISSNKTDFGECQSQVYTVTYPDAGTTFRWYVEWSTVTHPGWGIQTLGYGTSLIGWDLTAGDVIHLVTDEGMPDETDEWETIGSCED